MRRFALVAVAALFGIAGCGGSDGNNAPSVTKTTVTVQHNGTPMESILVQESVSLTSETVLNGGRTDASGQVTFDVPQSTTTGNLCFISVWYVDGNINNSRQLDHCYSLNSVPASVLLNYTD